MRKASFLRDPTVHNQRVNARETRQVDLDTLIDKGSKLAGGRMRARPLIERNPRTTT